MLPNSFHQKLMVDVVKEGLHLPEANLVREALELLTSQRFASTAKWQVLLQQATEQLKKRIITHWSVNVYQEVERLLNESTMRARILLHEHLRPTLQSSLAIAEGEANAVAAISIRQIENHLVHNQEEELLRLQQRIEALYHQEKREWEKYLLPTEDGVIRYLEEIIGVKLFQRRTSA